MTDTRKQSDRTLLPCPHCGSRNAIQSGGATLGFFIRCKDCKARGPLVIFERDAIPKWNNRAK